MKIWHGFGSEHSANLVMIGRFEDASEAAKAKEVIDRLKDQVRNDIDAKLMEIDGRSERFTDGMLALLGKVQVFSLSPPDLEQFAYGIDVRLDGNQVLVTTDEIEVSAFLKVLFDHGAKIEVYSAHHYKGTGHGR
jgi:hypothetical protein